MPRRPQPNRRRGLLRATAAVVGLIILLLIVVSVVSSLTAPTAKAPTVPPTVGPINRTPTSTTPTTHPSTPGARTPGTRTMPKPSPSATAKGKHKRIALAPLTLNEQSGESAYAALPDRGTSIVSPAVSPHGTAVAYFTKAGGAYQHVPLVVRDRQDTLHIGYGDRFIRPVWAPNGRYLLYLHVRETRGNPGARWTLMKWDRRVNRSQALTAANALDMLPLGWRHGHVIYMLGRSTASDVYTIAAGHTSYLATVLSQPLMNVSLSPDGNYLAFGAPANCGNCTLDLYDLTRSTFWGGPTGMPNGSTLAWTRGGATLVGEVNRRLAVVTARDHTVRYVALPPGIPRYWSNLMRASVANPNRIVLEDSVSGKVYLEHGATR